MPARFALHGLVAQLRSIEVEIEKIEAEILKWHRANETSRRLATIPGSSSPAFRLPSPKIGSEHRIKMFYLPVCPSRSIPAARWSEPCGSSAV